MEMMILSEDEKRTVAELEESRLYYHAGFEEGYFDYMAFAIWHGWLLVADVTSYHGWFIYGDWRDGNRTYIAIREPAPKMTLEDAYQQVIRETKKGLPESKKSVGKLFRFYTSEEIGEVYEKTPEDYAMTAI